MALVRWEPVRELSSLQSEMNRVFNTFFEVPTTPGDGGTRRWIPPMDLVETEGHFALKADLPGLGDGDVAIDVEGDVLTVSGERTADHAEGGEGFHRIERSYGSFRRSLTLPEGVDPAAVTATFDKGVLEIRIPKPEARKPRRVSITVGEQGSPTTIDANGTVQS